MVVKNQSKKNQLKRRMSNYRYIFSILAILVLVTSCSTTKLLGEDEQLYVGVKKMEIYSTEGADITSEAKSEVKSDLSVKPNNPLFSPYVRSPFPFGILIYQYCKPTKDKGFKHWFYEQFAKEPVLISTVSPDMRMRLVENKLQNMGYFNSEASYQLLPKKRDPKKVKISYAVDVAQGWMYDEIIYPSPVDDLTTLIDSLKTTSLIQKGRQYNTDTLSMERNRITSVLRNNGYYYFRPDYLRFLVDTTQTKYQVDIKMILEEGIPAMALRQYKVGKIDVNIESVSGVGEIDTLYSKRGLASKGINITYQKPKKVKWGLVRRNIRMRTGGVYSLDDQKQTQSNLSRTGVFSKVQIIPILSDTLNSDTLDFKIDLVMGKPLEAEFGINVTSKSNSFLGPGADFSISHNNVFGGAEKLTLNLNGAYEWQTGANHVENSALMNSYEFGARVSLLFPRLLLSKNMKKQRKYLSSTKFELGASILNRPKYFRMLSFDASMEYNFSTSLESTHMFNPFKLVYNKLLNTSSSFEATLNENPAIALSFRDQFIPMMRYAYTYTKPFGSQKSNKIYLRLELTQAGNLIDGIGRLCGVQGEKKIFGNQFSQFVKGQLEMKYSRRLWGENWLVSRFLVGAGHAYSNSTVMPYSEQFYIGGANSIRAFTVRSIGPGSYRPNTDNPNYYFDQTANFKLEANVEMRLKIYGGLQFALFLDAGNIWLLKDDPARPGGKLNKSTFFKDIALGTGCGIRYDLSVIVLRLDLGIGIHAPYSTDRTGYYNMPKKFKDSLGLHFAIGYPF